MTLPRGTVNLRIDYGEPHWREPLEGETATARAMCGYADFTHDGANIWVKFDGQHEIEMSAKGAEILADALHAIADFLRCGK